AGRMRRLVDPLLYGAEGQPHALWTRLRRHSTVTWCPAEEYPGFWAVTRHADVRTVSVAPQLFSSRTEVVATPLDPARGPAAPSILGTDPPEHRDYRNLTLRYFKPRALLPLESRVREITRALLDTAQAKLDFATDFAAWHPLRMLCEILGVSDEKV